MDAKMAKYATGSIMCIFSLSKGMSKVHALPFCNPEGGSGTLAHVLDPGCSLFSGYIKMHCVSVGHFLHTFMTICNNRLLNV